MALGRVFKVRTRTSLKRGHGRANLGVAAGNGKSTLFPTFYLQVWVESMEPFSRVWKMDTLFPFYNTSVIWNPEYRNMDINWCRGAIYLRYFLGDFYSYLHLFLRTHCGRMVGWKWSQFSLAWLSLVRLMMKTNSINDHLRPWYTGGIFIHIAIISWRRCNSDATDLFQGAFKSSTKQTRHRKWSDFDGVVCTPQSRGHPRMKPVKKDQLLKSVRKTECFPNVFFLLTSKFGTFKGSLDTPWGTWFSRHGLPKMIYN